MKKIIILTFLILSPLLTGCQGSDDGGGVIPREEPNDPNNPPPYEGPFGGPISNDDPIPPASPYLPPYNSIDLQALISNATPGGTIELHRDVILN